MRIVVVEDDYLQRDAIVEALARSFSDLYVGSISSEHEFRDRIDRLVKHPPDLVIMDSILRWCAPSPVMPQPPSDVLAGGPFLAGIRCTKLLQAKEVTARTPVIIYSVRDRGDLLSELEELGPHVLYVSKGDQYEKLVLSVRSLLLGEPHPAIEEERAWQRVWDAIEAKPGWLGFAVDLKKLLRRGTKTRTEADDEEEL